MRGPCLLLTLILIGFSGCSQEENGPDEAATSASTTNQGASTSTTPATGSVPPEGVENELTVLCLAYLSSVDTNRKCESIDDLKSAYPIWETDEDAGTLFEKIESGEIIVRWGLNDYSQILLGPNEYAVLAYERTVPTSGGWVVTADNNVIQWTPAEFHEKLGEQEN